MERCLDVLSQESEDFWVENHVEVLESPSTVEFMREAFSKYQPVIIRGAMHQWPGLSKWNKEYLINSCHGNLVNINLTSDGLGDCVKTATNDQLECNVVDYVNPEEQHFVYPAECNMTMAQFYELMETQKTEIIPYLSQQNDNLRAKFPQLLNDIQPLHFAEEAFGVDGPEAVNLWIGDERSVSSVHKDHFENMYCVLSGEKVFTLLPPTDVAFLPEYEYKTLRYKLKNEVSGEALDGVPTIGQSSEIRDNTLVLTNEGCPSATLSWIPLDPADPTVCDKYPLFRRAHPVHCVVKAGEILYIPAMWYHRVTQSQLTVSVNYWYDQRFDFRYVFYQTVKKLGEESEEKRKRIQSKTSCSS